MAAYVIVDIEIADPTGYEEYRRLVVPTIARYGGRFIVRGGACEPLEGGWEPKRLVVIEFANMDQARQWYHSPEYAGARAVRERAATGRAILVDGV